MKHVNSLSTTVSHLPGPQRLIRICEMLDLLNCSRTTLYRWVISGEFPAPKKRAGRTMGWKVTQYEQWLDNCC
ncbi:helix-turn-helix transcriptional regulator [Pantoea agglomerans]|uniref:helix-turn-helix transcriptional regulator n=1 Tax=Enterobacter agglomerans TaxID=549 RepID=UPI003C7A93E6